MSAFLSCLFGISFIALAWTYFGYPLLMAIRAKIQPRPVAKCSVESAALPSITLLIPAYNEADVIRRKLTNTLTLTYPRDRLEILVVDDGSDDSTANIVREFADRGVTLIQQPQRGGKIAAMNRGFAVAKGELVVLSDASPSYEPDSLQILVRSFADPEVGVVIGNLGIWDAKSSVAKPAGLYWKYEAALRNWESATGSTVAVHGNMFSLRRDLYHPLKPGTINDEFTVAMDIIRQGFRVVYEPDAISYDDASTKMRDEFNRRARINAGRYHALFSAGYLKAPNTEMTFRLFSHKLLRPLTPIFMLIMLIANLLAVVWPEKKNPVLSAINVLTLAGQALFYSLAGLGWLGERQERHNKLLNVVYFFVSSNAAALVGFWRWLRGKQRVTWQKRSVESPMTVTPVQTRPNDPQIFEATPVNQPVPGR
jgi:biofilm PGA synthesis N-glycosyltransferase PgaC